MKIRRSAIILIAAAIVIAAVFIYFDTRLLERIKDASQTQVGLQQGGQNGSGDISGSADGHISEDPDGTDEDAAAEELINSENVRVEYNSPEYDIEVTLCEDIDKKTFLRLRYYIDGISSVHDIYEEQIPELADIFENREGAADGGSGSQNAKASAAAGLVPDVQRPAASPYTIGQALLNPVLGRLYLLINGAPLDAYTQSSLYSVDLYDISVKKLFSYPAIYGKMSFSSDFALLAYDFEDPPLMSMYQEDQLFEVYDCITEEYLVRGSRRQDQSLIGPESEPGYIYDYIFNGWAGSDTVKLIRIARPTGEKADGAVRREVIYNVITDHMTNPDGSGLDRMDGHDNSPGAGEGDPSGTDTNGSAGDGSGEGVASGQQKDPGPGDTEGSGPVEVLKDFYSYLGSESDYDKAMKLLDDDFILRLGMLRQFGIEEIHKRDIDAGYDQNNVSMYSQLLKAAKFERVVDTAVSDDGTAVIKYYQALGLNAGSQVSQLMTAKLEKKGEAWTIKLIEDGMK